MTDFYLSGTLLYLPMIFHLVDVPFKELSWRHFQCALSRQFPHTNKSCWEIFSAAQDFSVSSFTSWLLVKDSLKPTFVITLPSLLSFDVTVRHSPCLWVEIWHNIGFSETFDAAFAVPPFMSLWTSTQLSATREIIPMSQFPIPIFKFFGLPWVSVLCLAPEFCTPKFLSCEMHW